AHRRDRSGAGSGEDRRPAAPGVLAHAPRRARSPQRLPQRRRAQDRRLVCEPERRRGPLRRRGGGVLQHQHARRTGLVREMNSLQDAISCVSGYDPDALPVSKANEVIRSFVKPISGVEKLPVRAALGRVLAKEIVSPIDVPSHDNSAMDGYAVRGADLSASAPVTLIEIGAALAGRTFRGAVGPGQCVRVMTGAVMPQGTDTVIIQEVAKIDGTRITIPASQETGQNRRLAGEDLKKGRPALEAGRLLRPADLGLVASLGIGEVTVRRKLRVAFFSTGDELVSVGKKLKAGEVYDSNRYTLWGM